MDPAATGTPEELIMSPILTTVLPFPGWPLFLLMWLLAGSGLVGAATPADARPASSTEPSASRRAPGPLRKHVITPHWFNDSARFWYRNELDDGAREFIAVDAENGVRAPAFDHERLAAGLSKAVGAAVRASHLPFEAIEFVDGAAAVRFRVGEADWQCHLTTYECTPAAARVEAAGGTEEKPPGETRRRRRRGAEEAGVPVTVSSPNGQWTAVIQDGLIRLRSSVPDAGEVPLGPEAGAGHAYVLPEWSPDSKSLIVWRVKPIQSQPVHLIESSPKEGGRAVLKTRAYSLPGDPFPIYTPLLFEVATGRSIPLEVDPWEHEWLRPRLRWSRAGDRFFYEQIDRGHQRLRLVEVTVATGAVRNLIDEKSETFIWTTHTEELRLDRWNWMEKTDEAIYVSERDGWRHLYLVDAQKDGVVSQITQGEWVVRGIEWIDEANRQIWLSASGRHPGQDPYLVHHYRVNFDGTGWVALTEGDGDHSLQYSPDRKYVIDTYSRVDLPPVNELRRVADGALVCRLEEADVGGLQATGWVAPEVFSAKGRDGQTDIWGIIVRPPDFDPAKTYPVIEDIYAGPQGAFVPKTFSPGWRHEALTRLGFIVVQIDGMGTSNRSKAFHDVCWRNLKDGGFPDRIAWMKAAAARYPQLDLTRVGIFGTSAGGQNAAGAVLFHPEFYKVAVANCGCHDNRMDKASWNEQWMGYPVGAQYAESSNIDHAHRLRGRLFLIVGELDDNVPPESTLRLADALIRAGKDFDLLVVPGGGHGAGGEYGQRRMHDFFVRHLQGVEPPDRNQTDPLPQ